MKKTLVILALAIQGISAWAQFEIDSVGKVSIGVDIPGVKNCVQLGNNPLTNYYDKANLYSKIEAGTNSTDVAIIGDANSENIGMGKRIGVLGLSGNTSRGYSYGVCGITANSRGAGVYGSNRITTDALLSGNESYAGYFNGPTYINGTVSSLNVLNHIDSQHLENINTLFEDDGQSLEHLLNINPIRYNYKIELTQEEADDVFIKEYQDEENDRIHFGLITEEIENIFPNLIYKEQDGVKAINYIELVPVLIQSIKELKKEVDELRGIDKPYAKAPGTTGINDTEKKGNVLFQNTPNPFKEYTTIRFQLADGVKDASICVFDLQGKMLKKIALNPTDERVTLNAYELGEGMFLYSLIVDGKEIGTKKMILTK